MENQHRKISGYRELTQEEIDLMNEIKAFGPELDSLCAKIEGYLTKQYNGASNGEEDRINDAEPDKWAQIGKAELQRGLMALTRAIAQPAFF